MNYRIVIVAGLVGYMVLAWLATALMSLTGVDLWVVRGFLAVLGISGFGIWYWWQSRREKQKQADAAQGAADPAGGGADEIDLLARDADAKLSTSNIGRIANLPAILIIGPPGAAKTHTILRSGLEAELLAGQIYQDNAVLPTRSANFWFARQTVLVEAGGKLMTDPARWARLVRKLEPRKLSNVVGKGEQAPRAVVVCFDIEDFLKPGASDNLAIVVRHLHARLDEISQTLGISFPVYVVFTKADRVPFFLDYVRNLANEEATQVFGATLPVETAQGGVWAEQAAQRFSTAFDDLFYSLADKRIPFLARENAGEKLPGIYEFPREFRKLRATVVQFLVDLSKPSQLRAAPFLRGFYFSGVRPVVVNEIAQQPAPARPAPGAFEQRSGATGLFHAAQPRPSQAPQPQVTGTRRVPQWIFLSHFWNDVVLADRAAISMSGASLKTNTLRRVLLATAAGLFLLYSVALLVSYARNKSLEGRVREAAQALSTVPPSGQDLPSADSLRRLDTLRQELARLSEYDRDGAPLSMRWGLYTGDEIYPEAYRLYFGRFHSLLFGGTQAGVLETLRRLPAAPAPTDSYGPPYNALKAYLITTAEWKRSTRAFLSPYLLTRWSENRGVDAERMQLAQKQFDFYSEELHFKNPYSTEGELPAVERARAYLKQFNADARIYQSLVDEASRRAPSVNFNRLFPNIAVSDSREVRGAFTKDGWKFMDAAFRKPDTFFGGEDWVLGPQTFANLDRAQLEKKLRGFYYAEFVKEWREYLRAGTVLPYQNLSDAGRKLDLISSNQSPLLALLCLVSQHTSIDAPEVKTAFQAPQQVVPSACQAQYLAPPNQPYMQALVGLGTSVKMVAGSPNPSTDPAAVQTKSQAQQALMVTAQVAQTFGIDKEGNVDRMTRKLMEDPITHVDRLLSGLGPGELRGKGQALCGQLRSLMAKYPFSGNPKSPQATIDDVNRFFRPQDGALWQFYTQSLQPIIEKQGAQYVAKSGGAMTVTPAFLAFFNRVMAFSDAAYPAGAQQPRLAYTLKSDLTGVNQTINLTLDGQTLANSSGKAAAKQFAWPGNQAGASMDVKFGGDSFRWPPFEGLWGTFEFFGDADEKAGHLEWTLKTGRSERMVTTASGQPVMVRFDLDMSPPVFRKGYFSSWSCTADVAK